MDLSVSLWSFLTFVSMLLIANFFLHLLAIRYADNNVGKALSVLT